MTTKLFLLDLLDEKESKLRNGTDSEARKMSDYLSISSMAAWKQIKLADIEKARRLVEKGPDEP